VSKYPIPLSPYGDWRCPCSDKKPSELSGLTPLETVVSLLERRCPFCGRKYKPEYRRDAPAPTVPISSNGMFQLTLEGLSP
jgi:hypothetical protein